MGIGEWRAMPDHRPAVVLVGHGARRNPTAGASLRRLADGLRRRPDLAAVEIAFVHGEPSLSDVLRGLGREAALRVVPIFAGEGQHTRQTIGAAIAAARIERPWCDVRQSAALGIHPGYAASLARRLRSLVTGIGLATRDAAFLAIGHGSRHAAMPADDAARRLADALRSDFASSGALYLDGEPAAESWPERFDRSSLVVAPVFFSDAGHASVDVPRLFGRPQVMPAIADGITGPWDCAGRRVWSVALPPVSTCVADIVVALAREAAEPGSVP